jgi:hypothetical protein
MPTQVGQQVSLESGAGTLGIATRTFVFFVVVSILFFKSILTRAGKVSSLSFKVDLHHVHQFQLSLRVYLLEPSVPNE